MCIAMKVSSYLDKSHIKYQLLTQQPSNNSLSSAINSNITTSQMVKAVILEDLQGCLLMAILAASHKISLHALNESLNRQFHIVKESHIYELFADCKHGAIPPIAQAYGLNRVYDKSLLEQQELYLEAGDHTSLIQLQQSEFKTLMQGAKALSFSYQLFH